MLLELSDNTILNGSDANGDRYLPQMLKLYADTFNKEPCGGCPKSFSRYLRELRNQIMAKEEKRAFLFKKDVMFPIMGTSESYSNENLTDEIALKILSKNPNAIQIFEKFPKDWKEQVETYKIGNTKVSTITEVEALTVKQIRTLFPEASGRSKDDLITDIREKYPELETKKE
jgi:spore cortex formation protein SpoVR/YcgB (stage V sporulation)